MIVILVAIIFAFGCTQNGKGSASPEFAQCLTEKGAKMYGAFWCPACKTQKETIGISVFDERINYIECSLPDRSAQTQICVQQGIERYPTWEFADGSRIEGVLTLQELSQLTGCQIS